MKNEVSCELYDIKCRIYDPRRYKWTEPKEQINIVLTKNGIILAEIKYQDGEPLYINANFNSQEVIMVKPNDKS